MYKISLVALLLILHAMSLGTSHVSLVMTTTPKSTFATSVSCSQTFIARFVDPELYQMYSRTSLGYK